MEVCASCLHLMHIQGHLLYFRFSSKHLRVRNKFILRMILSLQQQQDQCCQSCYRRGHPPRSVWRCVGQTSGRSGSTRWLHDQAKEQSPEKVKFQKWIGSENQRSYLQSWLTVCQQRFQVCSVQSLPSSGQSWLCSWSCGGGCGGGGLSLHWSRTRWRGVDGELIRNSGGDLEQSQQGSGESSTEDDGDDGDQGCRGQEHLSGICHRVLHRQGKGHGSS